MSRSSWQRVEGSRWWSVVGGMERRFNAVLTEHPTAEQPTKMSMTAPAKTSRQLIEDNQGLVRSLAKRIHRGLPSHVEFEDLVSYGQAGLAEAARSFDPEVGSQFSTFAYYRIRGAIYDGLAKMKLVQPFALSSGQNAADGVGGFGGRGRGAVGVEFAEGRRELADADERRAGRGVFDVARGGRFGRGRAGAGGPVDADAGGGVCPPRAGGQIAPAFG